MKNEWDVDAAIATYNVDGWGGGYFTVNATGNVVVQPLQEKGGMIDILEVVNEARNRGLSFPLVIRFQDLLRHRVESVNRAFQEAISEFGYKNEYRGVFPIKVNQLREVIEEIVDAGLQFHFGLEAGSKPELVAALAMHQDPESLIICNGYKDAAFIRIALLGCKLSKKVVIVAEKLEELEQTIRAAKEVGVEPYIGIRVRLYSKGSGKWAPSGGENAKFGLDTTSLVAASEMLKAAGLAHCLKLIHFHVGSQVPDISTIKRAVREAARYYAKIAKLGHELGYLDVGGGLGVDYDGSRSDFDSSANYSLQEYANDVVWNIMDLAEEFVKYLIADARAHCPDEMELFGKFVDKELLGRLDFVVDRPFQRITYAEAVELLKKSGEKFEFPVDYGLNLQSEHERWLTEKHFQCPVTVFNYPKEIKPFYMRVNDDGKTVTAMDLLVPGIGEIVGGSQREERLHVLEENMRRHNMDPADYKWYLDLRRYGTVPHSGFGLGFERMLMFITGVSNIRDVIPFARTPGSAEF